MHPSASTDAQFAALMQSAQAGDRQAYAELLRALVPLLRGAIRRWRSFLQPQDVEDIVQDVLLSIHAARATYDPGRPFLPWLWAVARNRMADSARRQIRRAANEVMVEDAAETFAEETANSPEPAYGDTEALRRAVTDLPPGQRRAIELLKLQEMSLKEAAAASGMSVTALKVAAHRGIRTLRKALGSQK